MAGAVVSSMGTADFMVNANSMVESGSTETEGSVGATAFTVEADSTVEVADSTAAGVTAADMVEAATEGIGNEFGN